MTAEQSMIAQCHNATNEVWFAIKQIADGSDDPGAQQTTGQQWRTVDLNKAHEIVPGILVPGAVLEEDYEMRHGMVTVLLRNLLWGNYPALTNDHACALAELGEMYQRLLGVLDSQRMFKIEVAKAVMHESVRLRLRWQHLHIDPEQRVFVKQQGVRRVLLAPLTLKDYFECEL